jgi:hypothetical protein
MRRSLSERLCDSAANAPPQLSAVRHVTQREPGRRRQRQKCAVSNFPAAGNAQLAKWVAGTEFRNCRIVHAGALRKIEPRQCGRARNVRHAACREESIVR